MARSILAVVALAALLLPFASAGLYSKSSPVLQLNEKTYKSEILNTNYTSIVEFYAPWCGHCKNLQPAFEQAARSLNGLGKVAAVDCDEAANKAFCGKMQIQGFPTLKIIKPGKKPGKPIVEDYNGQRNHKSIVSAVKDKTKNHVKRLDDGSIDAWMDDDKAKPRAILFSDKSLPTALLKALAIDFLDSISIGQVRSKDKALCERFGVTTFPSLVLFPGGDAAPLTHSGKLVKTELVGFLSQAAPPNRDARPRQAADKKPKQHPPADEQQAPLADSQPAGRAFNPIGPLFGDDAARKACLQRTSGTCVLFFEDADESDMARTLAGAVLTELTKIRDRMAGRDGAHFAYYSVQDAPGVRAALGVSEDTSVVAVNAKRGWIKRFVPGEKGLEHWVDGLRLGEGEKEALSDAMLEGKPVSPPEPEAGQPEPVPVPEQTDEDAVPPEPEAAAAPVKDEL